MNTGIVFAKLNKKINFRRNNIVFYYLPEYALLLFMFFSVHSKFCYCTYKAILFLKIRPSNFASVNGIFPS